MSEFPCDGGCNVNDGPSEECSAHGRPPAQIWEIVAEVSKQRDAALARIARVEALHYEDDHACAECSFESMPEVGFRGVAVPYPCPTVQALTDDPVS